MKESRLVGWVSADPGHIQDCCRAALTEAVCVRLFQGRRYVSLDRVCLNKLHWHNWFSSQHL